MLTEEDRKVVDWISPYSYGKHHSDVMKRRHPETCRWFFDSQAYRYWLETENRTLYLPGIPGAGKTILVSAIIHHISQKFSTDSTVGLAYIYFDFSRQEEQTVEHALASLLGQLLRKQASLPDNIRKLRNAHQRADTRLPQTELSEALHSVAALYKRVFIVLDALDECTTDNQCRAVFLTEILGLQARQGVNVIATSRAHEEIASKLSGQGTSTETIIARDEDIEIVLQSRMKATNRQLFDDNLRREIVSKIIDAAGGM